MKYGNRGKGYNRPGYSWSKAMRFARRKGAFKTVSGGSGHAAGESWGNTKDIDPESQQRRYSKNSPSFDEGVWISKQKRRSPETQSKIMKVALKMAGEV